MRRSKRLISVLLALFLGLWLPGGPAFPAFGQVVSTGRVSRPAFPATPIPLGGAGTVRSIPAGAGISAVSFQGSLPLLSGPGVSLGTLEAPSVQTAALPESLLPSVGGSSSFLAAAPSVPSAAPSIPGAADAIAAGNALSVSPAGRNNVPDEESANASGARFDGGLLQPQSSLDAVALDQPAPITRRLQFKASGGEALGRGYPDRVAELGARLPGRLDVRDYVEPDSISRPRKLALAGHFAALALGGLAVAAGLGLAAALPAFMWAGTDLVRQARKLSQERPTAFSSNLYGEGRRSAEAEGRGLLRLLTTRMGAHPSQTPRFSLSNDHGPMGGTSEGTSVDPDAVVTLGEGYQFKRIEIAAAVVGHELGHLLFGDPARQGFLRQRWGAHLGLRFLKKAAVVGTAVKTAVFAPGLQTLIDPFGLTLGLSVMVAGLAVMRFGLALGMEASRQEEFRADHFSAWLTRPEWLADFFSSARESDSVLPDKSTQALFQGSPLGNLMRRVDSWLKDLEQRVFSTHPDHASREKRLSEMAEKR
ncbi:MAG: M48 family metalloprotease [Elusimicrobiota bacterium]|jgi:hypothetical protein